MSVLSCRNCSSKSLWLVVDLGLMPPCRRFLTPELAALPEPIHPLRLLRCDGCGLLQTEASPPLDHEPVGFAAADDPHAFLRGLRDAVAVFEIPNLHLLHDGLAYDLIGHETRCYWSVTQLRDLLRGHGLELVDVQPRPDHAGTLRLTAQRRGRLPVRATVAAALAREHDAELNTAQAWADFADLVQQGRDLLNSELEELEFRGKSVAAWSSGGRGMTLLAYCGSPTLRLPCLIDDCPALHGLLTPEDRIPIVGPDVLRRRHFDVLLVLGGAWDARADGPLHKFWQSGGRILLPTPKPHYADPAPAPHLTARLKSAPAALAFADFG